MHNIINQSDIRRNNDGVRAATIYIARETGVLKQRIEREGPGKVRKEIKAMFEISDSTVQRLFESCDIPWARQKKRGAVDLLKDLEERVARLEQRLL